MSGASTERVFYHAYKPYEVPDSLDQLRGPRGGSLELPINVYWGPERVVNLDRLGGRRKAYQATLREGRVVDQERLLNRDVLVEVWPELTMPVRLQELWESRFPELRQTSVRVGEVAGR